MNPENAYSLINPQFKPFSHQIECWKLIKEEGPGYCLQSGTGSGKTEAICIPSIFLNKRLVMVYPTRSLIEDQIGRLEQYSMKVVSTKDNSEEMFLSKTIAYDTGDRQFGERITRFESENSLNIIEGKLKFYQRLYQRPVEIVGREGKRKELM